MLFWKHVLYNNIPEYCLVKDLMGNTMSKSNGFSLHLSTWVNWNSQCENSQALYVLVNVFFKVTDQDTVQALRETLCAQSVHHSFPKRIPIKGCTESSNPSTKAQNIKTKFGFLSFSQQIFSLSFQRHVTASRLKIHQQQRKPRNKTFPFLLMAFVFEHVTCLGLAAMSLTAPSGNRLN